MKKLIIFWKALDDVERFFFVQNIAYIIGGISFFCGILYIVIVEK